MPINWPPSGAPSWPPPETHADSMSFSDLRMFVTVLFTEYGFTHAAPTPQEQADFFQDARCDEGHAVIGRMLVSPSAVRYPVAVCNSGSHRDVLVLWPPYYCGFQSRNYEFVS